MRALAELAAVMSQQRERFDRASSTLDAVFEQIRYARAVSGSVRQALVDETETLQDA